MGETIPVRPDEAFDVAAVASYLRRHLHGLPDAPLQVEQFPAGHSNLTYLLRMGQWEAVLRRPPLGPVPPKAHDMERECRILSLLHSAFPLAPRPLLYCGDRDLIGASFYVMERRHGVVLDTAWHPEWPETPEVRRRISLAVVDTLAALHAVDFQAGGLGAIGRPEGYLERQVHGWIQRWERAKTDEVPGVSEICAWLTERIPPSPAPAIVHNDFKLNNMMFAAEDPGRPVAVLDWEMCTVGDPLTDVGALLAYWNEPQDEEVVGRSLVSVSALPGFLTRREMLQRYAERTGRDVSNIGYYLAFAYFKIAVILQQIYYRWRRGQTRDERFRHLGEVAANMIRQALRVARTGQF